MARFYSWLVLLLLAGTGLARAGERLEAALYLGENGPPPLLSHLASPEMSARLQQVFGFGQYRLLKSGRIDLHHPWAQWFVPRKDFFISVRPLLPQGDEPQLVDYDIYQEGFLVAKGKYEPREDTPLFINGPDFRKGRLILVLETH